MEKKVVIIGLDGMPWHILQLLVDRGITPNLKDLIQKGARGILKSTIPPYTATSWTSIATGVNPGKHGVFSFLRYDGDKSRSKLLNGFDVMYPRIHEMLMLKNLKSVMVNLPLSYPFIESELLIMITDWLSPRLVAYPDDVKRLVSSYHYPKRWDFDRKIRISELEGRIKSVLNLFENTEWNFFFVVFSEPDWIMHLVYDDIEHNRKTAQIAYEMFSILDKFIGHVTSKMNENDLLIILSDHGFQVYDKVIHINTILLHADLLSKTLSRAHQIDALDEMLHPGKRRTIPIPRWLFEIGSKNRIIQNVAWKLFKLVFGDGASPEIYNKYCVDFLSSKVSIRRTDSGIFVNSQSFSKSGAAQTEMQDRVVEKTVETLSKIQDPTSGVALFTQVMKREDVYWGPYVKLAPDVLFVPNMGAGYMYIHSEDLHTNIVDRKQKFGWHSLDGVLLAYGKDVQSGMNLRVMNTYDVVPTVLHYFGLPLPHDTDGRVLFEMFHEDSNLNNTPIKQSNYEEPWRTMRARLIENEIKDQELRKTKEQHQINEREKEKIKDRLRALGYI